MGCNSSSVVPLGDSDIEDSSGIKVHVNPSTPEMMRKASPIKKTKRGFFLRKSNTTALESSEPPVETLTSDFNMLSPEHGKRAGPLAFEVPAHEDGNSLIRKHPPKRFRRLEEQQQDLKDLTHESIDERQLEAEQRRIEILTQRIQSAKQRNPHNRKFVHSDAFNQESEDADWEKNM